MIMLAGATLVAGCGTTQPIIAPSNPLKQLQHSIDMLLADSTFESTHACIKVVSLGNGRILYDHDSKALMNPASNIKLITAAAALSVLDTGYLFTTSVFADTLSGDGTVARTLYLKGYGNPDLTTSDLDTLALIVRRSGVTTILKNIIIDDSYFDDSYWGDGWSWDDAGDPDAPSINALSVNKNCITVTITADARSTSIALNPATDFITVFNKTTVVSDTIRTPLRLRRFANATVNTLLVEGEMFGKSQTTKKIALCNPSYYAGALFKESLQRAGIAIRGTVTSGTIPDGIHEIARQSQPIGKVISTMNKQSDNLSAENLLKVMGARQYNLPGSAKNGIAVEKKFLAGLGMDTTKFVLADGSGVSRYNLLSADELVQFLAAMKKQTRLFPMFYQSLPAAGLDGTLEYRMTDLPAVANLRAKTGTLNGTSCLSGYVTTRDGDMLAFSILMQHFIYPTSDYHLVQDKIGSLLAGFTWKTSSFQK